MVAAISPPPAVEEGDILLLSPLDSTYHTMTIQLGYSLPTSSFDLERFERALGAVSTRWTCLTGRLRWSKVARRWSIVLPSSPVLPAHATYRLTTTVSPRLISPPLFDPSQPSSSLSSSPPVAAAFLPSRPSSLFAHPATPSSSAAFAATSAPLLHVHVSFFADATVVGLTMPHSVVDGVGFGLVMRSLQAELRGEPWAPADLGHVAALAARLSSPPPPKVPAGAAAHGRLAARGPADTLPLTWVALAWMVLRMVWEAWGAEKRVVWLQRDAFERLVSRVKKQVEAQTDGREFVSTGDVLLAWFLNAVSRKVPGDSTKILRCQMAFDMRATISSSSTAQEQDHTSYPHNCLSLYKLPPLAMSTLASLPLSTLAVHARRALDAARTPTAVSSAVSWHAAQSSGDVAYRMGMNESVFFITNQIRAGFGRIALPVSDGADSSTTMEAVEFNVCEDELANMVSINELGDGGFVIECKLQRWRWEGVKQAMEELGRPED